VQESNVAVDNFIARHGLSYPFLLDIDGAISRNYDIYTTPTTYFVKPDGVIASILPGVVSQQWIDGQMKAIQG
jgi:peroxiredoxin